MSKGKSTWKYNKLLTARRNYFLPGGPLNIRGLASPPPVSGDLYGAAGPPDPSSLAKDTILNTNDVIVNTNNTKKNTEKSGTGSANFGLGNFGGVIAQSGADIAGMIGNLTSSDISDRRDEMIGKVKDSVPAGVPVTSDSYDALTNDWANTAFTDYVDYKQMGGMSGGRVAANAVSQTMTGATSGASLGPIGIAAGAAGGLITSLFGSFGRNRRARNAAYRVNDEIDEANKTRLRQLINRGNNLLDNTMMNLEANARAFGGELHSHGGYFTNGLLSINNGGSHEQNLYEGVPMGMDQKGVPNLVEEGETIFKDYVFSKRLMVPSALRAKYKLGGTISFADASKELVKESEERPNDPISQRGLEALMSDLASSQESIKDNGMNREFAEGGRLFGGGGLKYNNGVLSESDPLYNIYKDYLTDGAIDFSKLYASDSAWMSKRAKVLELLDKGADESKTFREWYANKLNEYNKGRKGYIPYKADDITKDLVSRWSSDKKLGFGHNVFGDEELSQHIGDRKTAERRYILGPEKDANGTPLDPYATATIIKNYDPDNAKYSYVSKKAKSEGDTDYTDYYYKKLEEDKAKAKAEAKDRNFTRKGKTDKYTEYTDEDFNVYAKNNNYRYSSSAKNDTGGTDYFYDLEEEDKQGKYAGWLSYAPFFEKLGETITDAAGITNKPDYSSADALLETSKDAGNFQSVEFNPIGDYLTEEDFDRDYYISKLKSESGAARKAILNTAGDNKAQAMANIVASDYNAQTKIGDLFRQAEEYNFANREKVKTFNRATNMTNSQNLLQADMANQEAGAKMRDISLRGIQAAYQMRDAERNLTDANKSANLSGLFQTLGDIGWQERNMGMVDWANRKGVFGPGTDDYVWVKKPKQTEQTEQTVRAKGGKIKRKKKGLTF